MAHGSDSVLPPPSPEHRRIAAGKFERANQVVATGNFDYAIHLLLDCCRLDPANLLYRQALRRTEKAKYRNNLRGSWLAWLTTWPKRARLKAALRAREYLKVLEHGEEILAHNPWDVGAQMDMAASAVVLGLLDLAVWSLEQARQKQARDPALNRALARLYERRGNFTQAMALWQLVLKALPGDVEASEQLKALAVHDTITRGNLEGALLARGEAPSADDTQLDARSADVPTASKVEGPPAETGPGAREAAPLWARLQADPTNPEAHLALARVYRRFNQLDQAHAVLTRGLDATGRAFELSAELADLEIEPFRRNLAVAEEKLKASPDDPDLRRLRIQLRKEVNTRELELFRQKADRFPAEMTLRYELGVRLLRAGQLEEAIRELQAARSDPRVRWQSLLYLGYGFKARNNWGLAQRNFEEALQHLPANELTQRKEVLFELARGHAEAGDLHRAVEFGRELAYLDFTYRDVGRLLDEWQGRLQEEVSSEG